MLARLLQRREPMHGNYCPAGSTTPATKCRQAPSLGRAPSLLCLHLLREVGIVLLGPWCMLAELAAAADAPFTATSSSSCPEYIYCPCRGP